MHPSTPPPLVNGTGNSPSLEQPTPGVVQQDKSSGGSVDTTKTRLDPQRVRMNSGERPIGAAEGKQSDIEALCQPPPPPVVTRTRCWFRGQTCRNTGLPCLDKPVSPHATYHRTYVADRGQPSPFMTTEWVPNSPAHTPEHKSTWHRIHTNTLTPTLPLPAAGTELQTMFFLCWIGTAKTMGPEKAQKCGDTGLPCLDKPVLGGGCRGAGAAGNAGAGLEAEPLPRDASEGEGPQRRPQKRLDRRLEGVTKAGGGRLLSVTHAIEAGSCRQGTAAGRKLGGGRGGSHPSNASLPLPVGTVGPTVQCPGSKVRRHGAAVFGQARVGRGGGLICRRRMQGATPFLAQTCTELRVVINQPTRSPAHNVSLFIQST